MILNGMKRIQYRTKLKTKYFLRTNLQKAMNDYYIKLKGMDNDDDM